jgi:hypothetical protein
VPGERMGRHRARMILRRSCSVKNQVLGNPALFDFRAPD